MKQIILIGELLTDPVRGIYIQTIWYSDGSVETKKVPKGPILIIKPIVV